MTDETSYGSVEQRLDACDRSILYLTNKLADLQNECSLLVSVQRLCADIDARILKVEQQYAELLEYIKGLRAQPRTVTSYRSSTFGSVGALVVQIESMFDCQDGDYHAFHTVADERGVRYYQYVTIGVIAPASIPDAQEKLRQALYETFKKLRCTCKSDRPVLYWRYSKEQRILEDKEQYAITATRYKIMTRVAIPEADFSVAERYVKLDTEGYIVLKE